MVIYLDICILMLFIALQALGWVCLICCYISLWLGARGYGVDIRMGQRILSSPCPGGPVDCALNETF